uniref:Putative secreted protein n=1 Tax=Anopheles darlingi TaxID=43151 RepID=A0A2M4D6X2_ANODA
MHIYTVVALPFARHPLLLLLLLSPLDRSYRAGTLVWPRPRDFIINVRDRAELLLLCVGCARCYAFPSLLAPLSISPLDG